MRTKNKKVIFIGGFGYGQDMVDQACKVLSKKFGNVKGYTFSDAMHNRRVISRQVNGADIIVHSAGILALKNTLPNSVIAYGCPLGSSSNFIIFFKTIYKSFQTLFIFGASKTAEFHKSSTKEILRRIKTDEEHTMLKYYLNGSITKCDSVVVAQDLIDSGCKKIELIYGEKDVFFKPAQKDFDRVDKIKKLKIKLVPKAIHDEIILNDDLSNLWN